MHYDAVPVEEVQYGAGHDHWGGVFFEGDGLRVKEIEIANMGYCTLIYDYSQAGQEQYKSITRSYYRGSIGVVLTYDITNRKTYSNLGKWLEEIKQYSNNDKISIMLVGNKSDLNN